METFIGFIMMLIISAALILGTMSSNKQGTGGLLSAIIYIGDFFWLIILIAYVTKAI